MEIRELLELAVDKKASDLHLSVGAPPTLRINGQLRFTKMDKLTPADTKKFMEEILSKEQQQSFNKDGEIDLSYSISGLGRFRMNVFKQQGNVSLAIRVIPTNIPSIEMLSLPPVIKELALKDNGLILVTGPTGSGKSTTLAAMIDLINSQRQCHIITLEDPIEYIHRHKKSLVNQREIGRDSSSFARALRAALREDPDVILVGEMRDLETISTALTAAETGHLVLSTLHTKGAVQTIDRIIDVFPAHQQHQIRIQLAETLLGVVYQKLLPKRDFLGRIAAVEVLISTPAVRNLIREAKTHQIASVMQTGSRYGMQSMDYSIAKLYKEGLISHETALSSMNNKENLIGYHN